MATGIQPASAPQLLFAVSFATFLVAIAGATVAVLRPHLVDAGPRARVALSAGFLALAGAAFARGSLLAGEGSLAVIGLQALAVLLLGLATLGWHGEKASRWSLWSALVLLVTAEVARESGAVYVAGWAGGAGAMALGGVLVASARRSIPARFAVALAATLLLSVLALSVTLSIVISTTVEREALKRVEARARAEAEEVTESALRNAVNSARLAALTIQGSRADELLDLAAGRGGGTAPDVIARDLRLLADQQLLVADGPLLYATARRVIVVAQRVDQADAEALVASRAVDPVAEVRAESNGAVEVVAGHALAVGVHRVTARGPDGAALVGFVEATRRLDAGYLVERASADPAVTLSLADPERVFASVGGDLTQDAVIDVTRRAIEAGSSASAVRAGLFLAAQAVPDATGNPVLAVVSSISTSAEGTQVSLFRILFVVALVTALVAFVLAVAVGESIGRGLHRLAGAAEQIAQGDFSVRASVTSRDEVGTLGATFDSMASSIESLTSDLRRSVAEEAGVRGRLEAVVAGMGEALLAVDAGGRVTIFNGAAQDLFGCTAESVVGRPVGELGPITTEDGTDLVGRLTEPTSQPWSTAAVVFDAHGQRVPVALSAGGLKGPDGPVGSVYVLRDMRAEREAERAKAELLANISHELRTPLVPIKGYAKLLLGRDLPPARSQESLGAIVTAADRLESAVERLIAIAASEADSLPGSAEVDPVSMVKAVVGRWNERVDERHHVRAEAEVGIPGVRGDRAALERGLDELVANAVKFSPEGGDVVVSVRLEQPAAGSEEPPGVALSVSDLGVGVPEDRLGAIFDTFAQGDASATREFGGLGLGLALVRRIVAAHGGELRCTSEPGRGSTFTMHLPAAGSVPVAPSSSGPPAEPA